MGGGREHQQADADGSEDAHDARADRRRRQPLVQPGRHEVDGDRHQRGREDDLAERAPDVGAVEPVKVPFGQSNAWNLKVAITDPAGEHTWKNAEMWISNDARRLPLKMQAELPFGHFVLLLSSVK